MIASDVNNPDFVGARNPDGALSVLFYSTALQNNFKTEQEGRPIFEDVEMVKIFLPGDDKTVVDTYVREEHKRRFPLQWAHFKNKQDGEQQLAGKTPLSAWARITPAQVQELRAMKFLSVEDVANASDLNIQALGSVAGMGAHAFREAARNYLRVAAGEAADTKTSQALADMTAQNEQLRAQMAAMQQQNDDRFAALAKQTAAPDVSVTDTTAKKQTKG